MKKRNLFLFLMCILILGFAGCSNKSISADYDFETLSSQLEKSGAFSDILSPVELDVAAQFYGIDPKSVAESKVLFSTGATTEEIGLFKCIDNNEASKVKEAAELRKISQKNAYESYAPGEMPKLDDAIITQNGVYVFYIVSANSSKVQEILNQNI